MIITHRMTLSRNNKNLKIQLKTLTKWKGFFTNVSCFFVKKCLECLGFKKKTHAWFMKAELSGQTRRKVSWFPWRISTPELFEQICQDVEALKDSDAKQSNKTLRLDTDLLSFFFLKRNFIRYTGRDWNVLIKFLALALQLLVDS